MWIDRRIGATERPIDRVVLGIGAAIALVAAVVVLLTGGNASADGDQARPVPNGQTPSAQVNGGLPLDDTLLSGNPGTPVLSRAVLPAPSSSSGRATRSADTRPPSGGYGFTFTGSAPTASIPTTRGCAGSVLGAIVGLLSTLVGGSSNC